MNKSKSSITTGSPSKTSTNALGTTMNNVPARINFIFNILKLHMKTFTNWYSDLELFLNYEELGLYLMDYNIKHLLNNCIIEKVVKEISNLIKRYSDSNSDSDLVIPQQNSFPLKELIIPLDNCLKAFYSLLLLGYSSNSPSYRVLDLTSHSKIINYDAFFNEKILSKSKNLNNYKNEKPEI
ncbi:hypothetical protein H8356DRAFT_1333638 [Neocallimastix lanati (nom. inval.)]|nr:hypothetical protein H8356DRAFT_1333638 [Neocallimastix sp. JGI-2020a]